MHYVSYTYKMLFNAQKHQILEIFQYHIFKLFARTYSLFKRDFNSKLLTLFSYALFYFLKKDIFKYIYIFKKIKILCMCVRAHVHIGTINTFLYIINLI